LGLFALCGVVVVLVVGVVVWRGVGVGLWLKVLLTKKLFYTNSDKKRH
jgi:hypothetical protein